jgi:PhnB protein
MAVKPVPEGYRSVTPVLTVDDAAKAIEFYKKVFGAEGDIMMPGPGGKIAHAELRIGDSMIMISDAFPQWGTPAAPSKLFMYVADCDAVAKKAIAAGAKETMPFANQFWGDRFGKVVDPWNIEWALATHVEDVSPEEMERRQKAEMANPGRLSARRLPSRQEQVSRRGPCSPWCRA